MPLTDQILALKADLAAAKAKAEIARNRANEAAWLCCENETIYSQALERMLELEKELDKETRQFQAPSPSRLLRFFGETFK